MISDTLDGKAISYTDFYSNSSNFLIVWRRNQPLVCSVYLQPLEDSLKQAKEVSLNEVKQAFYRLYAMHTY